MFLDTKMKCIKKSSAEQNLCLKQKYSAMKNSERKAYLAPILYIPVPQTGHLPFIAGLPFFIVTFSGFSTSLFARHLTQYIETAIITFTSSR